MALCIDKNKLNFFMERIFYGVPISSPERWLRVALERLFCALCVRAKIQARTAGEKENKWSVIVLLVATSLLLASSAFYAFNIYCFLFVLRRAAAA